MSHIFISYSHQDSEYAHLLASSLEQAGFTVWIDNRIDYGTQWPHVIQENLDSCAAFIVIMTLHSYQSEWVQNELSRAKRKKKPVFPLLLEGDEPWLSVEAVQYIDVRKTQLPPANFYSILARIVPPSTVGKSTTDLKSAKEEQVEGGLAQLKHQFQIHMDISTDDGNVRIEYSYPFTENHLLEPQLIIFKKEEVPTEVQIEITTLLSTLRSRVPSPHPVRYPYAEITPTIRMTVATVVIQDQTQPYPIVRQYYLEEIAESSTRHEKQVRLTPQDFSQKDMESYNRLRHHIKAIVWNDYRRKFGKYFSNPD